MFTEFKNCGLSKEGITFAIFIFASNCIMCDSSDEENTDEPKAKRSCWIDDINLTRPGEGMRIQSCKEILAETRVNSKTVE